MGRDARWRSQGSSGDVLTIRCKLATIALEGSREQDWAVNGDSFFAAVDLDEAPQQRKLPMGELQ